jgi:DNA invertase Pin-like site-specific DNA recombinase
LDVGRNVIEGKMVKKRFVSYLRVSTDKQGASGLGLEAQRAAVAGYLKGTTPLREIVEVESGKRADRPALAEALRLCKLHRATLVIAKLDRLARNVHFISGLMLEGVDFVAVDMPSANKLTVHILAAVAEDEAERISQRTKAALEAAKARGVKLGGNRLTVERLAEVSAIGRTASAAIRSEAATFRAASIQPLIAEIQTAGITTLRGIADALNGRGIQTARGGQWSAVQVQRVLAKTA